MKALRTVVITVACVLFACAAAEAADLYSPPLFVDYNQLVVCDIANVSTQTGTVKFEIINPTGTVVSSSDPLTIEPGIIRGGGAGGPEIYGLHYCHFILGGLNKNQVRAAIKIRNSDSGDIVTLPAE